MKQNGFVRLLKNAAPLLVFSLTLALTGCKPDPNVQFIQGTWYYNDAHLGSVVAEPGQETYWTFDRGAFEFSTCCFYKAVQYGHYRVVESEGAELKLELFNIEGHVQGMSHSIPDARMLRIVIDAEADTLRIDREEPFSRTTPRPED